MKSGLEHAVEAGLLLIEAKGQARHGGWLKWVDANCKFSRRTAQLYVQMARHTESLGLTNTQRAAHLTCRATVRAMHAERVQEAIEHQREESKRRCLELVRIQEEYEKKLPPPVVTCEERGPGKWKCSVTTEQHRGGFSFEKAVCIDPKYLELEAGAMPCERRDAAEELRKLVAYLAESIAYVASAVEFNGFHNKCRGLTPDDYTVSLEKGVQYPYRELMAFYDGLEQAVAEFLAAGRSFASQSPALATLADKLGSSTEEELLEQWMRDEVE